MRWYEGPSLFHYIETIDLTRNKPKIPSRFQVQYVIRPQTEQLPDYRGYAGTVISGNFSIYDEVIIFPLERKIRIVKIEKNQIPVQFAAENEPVVLHFEEDFDIGRGSSIVKTSELPLYSDQLEATICWMDNKPFVKDQKFMLQHNSLCVKAVIKEVVALIDVNTAKEVQVGDSIELNDICKVSLKLSTSIAYDTYSTNRKNGAFILINEITNNTVAAGVLL
jgi:sulfate adenylyltransferase subunit 1